MYCCYIYIHTYIHILFGKVQTLSPEAAFSARRLLFAAASCDGSCTHRALILRRSPSRAQSLGRGVDLTGVEDCSR